MSLKFYKYHFHSKIGWVQVKFKLETKSEAQITEYTGQWTQFNRDMSSWQNKRYSKTIKRQI